MREFVKRVLAEEPMAVGAVLAALYAVGSMLWAVKEGSQPFDPDTVTALVAAVGAVLARGRVTPTANPRADDGTPLMPSETAL